MDVIDMIDAVKLARMLAEMDDEQLALATATLSAVLEARFGKVKTCDLLRHSIDLVNDDA